MYLIDLQWYMIVLPNRQYVDNMFWMCWVISIMLEYVNDIYEKWCVTEKCDLNWFERFDCLLLLGFKLCKCWFMNWCVKLFMDLFWKHELNACSWNEKVYVYCFKACGISIWMLNVHRSEVYNPRETTSL